jgi:hypothetical protein
MSIPVLVPSRLAHRLLSMGRRITMRLLDGATLGLATQVPAVYPGQGYRCGAAESFEEAVLCPLRHMFDQKGPVPPPTASQANQYILPQPPEFCAWPEAGGDVLETLFQVTPTSTDLACVCYSSTPIISDRCIIRSSRLRTLLNSRL